MKKVLVCRSTDNEFTKLFIQELNACGSDQVVYEYWNFKNFMLKIDNQENTFIVNGKDIREFSAIYFLHWRGKYKNIGHLLAYYAKQNDIFFIDEHLSNLPTANKAYQTLVFSMNGVGVPKSVVSNFEYIDYEELKKFLGNNFVAKALASNRGKDNYLMKSKEDFAKRKAEYKYTDFIFQEFIPNSFDFRALVVGGKDLVYLKKRSRLNKQASHLNNTSQGAENTFIEDFDNPIYHSLVETAKKAARLSGLDITGVDLVFKNDDLQSQPFVLEANPSPSISGNVSRYANGINKFLQVKLK